MHGPSIRRRGPRPWSERARGDGWGRADRHGDGRGRARRARYRLSQAFTPPPEPRVLLPSPNPGRAHRGVGSAAKDPGRGVPTPPGHLERPRAVGRGFGWTRVARHVRVGPSPRQGGSDSPGEGGSRKAGDPGAHGQDARSRAVGGATRREQDGEESIREGRPIAGWVDGRRD